MQALCFHDSYMLVIWIGCHKTGPLILLMAKLRYNTINNNDFGGVVEIYWKIYNWTLNLWSVIEGFHALYWGKCLTGIPIVDLQIYKTADINTCVKWKQTKGIDHLGLDNLKLRTTWQWMCRVL